MTSTQILRKNSGQVMVESLLMLVLFVAIATFVMKQVRSNEWFASMLSKPWTAVSIMIENGVWDTNLQSARAKNPTQFARVVSFKGEVEQ